MIKKTILMLLLLNAFLFSGSLDSIGANYHDRKVTFELKIHKTHLGDPFIHGSKDWVGLYKKGQSTAWKNVLTWAWVKDFKGTDIAEETMRLSKNINLQDGEYEVRYFRDNSFTTYKSSSFTVERNTINIHNIRGFYEESGKVYFYIYLEDIEKNLNNGSKDWLGIYKKGDSNSWGNVVTWAWAKNFTVQEDGPIPVYKLKQNINLKDGEYEVRYFRDNSFTTYKSSTLLVDTSGINLDAITAVYTPEYTPHIIFSLVSFLNTKLRPNPKDWIGFYKKGDSNSWGNVITWVWVKDIINNKVPTDTNVDTAYIFKKVNLQSGEYEARYFLNNTYKTYKSSSCKVN